MRQTQTEPNLVHPLRTWRGKNQVSVADLVARLAALGRVVSPRFIDAIENRYRHPGYDLAEDLFRITKISVAVLKKHPLRPNARSKSAA